MITLLGWIVRPRINRLIAAKDAARIRVRDFLDLVADTKGQIATSGNPEFWVVFFTDEAAPALKAGFDKISRDLREAERVRLRDRVDAVVAFSTMRPADIYPQQQELLAAIENIELFQDP